MKKTREALLDTIRSLKIIDTHEHLPLEKDLPVNGTDVLASWLSHYFSCDLVSAGMTDKELVEVRNPVGGLAARWSIVEPYWKAARNTGYGRALERAARDLFGIGPIGAATIGALNEAMLTARRKGNYYRWVLGEKSGITVSILDCLGNTSLEEAIRSPDPFVLAYRADRFILPLHRMQMREAGEQVGVSVHTLEDWEETLRRTLERDVVGLDRVVCLKCGLAYLRTLRFEKPTRAEAELSFNAYFDVAQGPACRQAAPPSRAFQDFMMHAVCRFADEHGLTYQIHTGLQEGNGNVITDANPTHLINLFLEYENVKFDVFHMGYPYVMEAGALAKNFRNVFLDMCWGHVISPEASRRTLAEWLDAVPANKIMGFGGDYLFPEGVYGHQAMARENVAATLAGKVEEGAMDLEWAMETARRLFVGNPAALFGLEAHAR